MRDARVLVVDDDDDFRELLRFTLEEEGYEVADAADGLQALAVIERVRPDLILVDMDMPRMAGAAFVKELGRRSVVSPFRVVTVSGNWDSSQSPTPWFLPKPMDLDLLLGVVGDFCGRGRLSPLWVRPTG
jgi:CheY-like chemotaxis protein